LDTLILPALTAFESVLLDLPHAFAA